MFHPDSWELALVETSTGNIKYFGFEEFNAFISDLIVLRDWTTIIASKYTVDYYYYIYIICHTKTGELASAVCKCRLYFVIDNRRVKFQFNDTPS